MSEKEGLLDQLKAYVADLLAPKAEAVEEEAVEETVEESVEEVEEVEEEVTEESKDAVDVEAINAKLIKAEIMESIQAEIAAKDSKLEQLQKELDKANASRKPLEAKEDVVNPEAKVKKVDELGAAILNILKSSYKS